MEQLSCVPISEARRLAKKHGAAKLLILGIDDDGRFAFTTFGRTKKQCDQMRRWADENAPRIGLMMDEAQ